MSKYAEMGFTTFDMADIYGPAEDIFGHFMQIVSFFLHCCLVVLVSFLSYSSIILGELVKVKKYL